MRFEVGCELVYRVAEPSTFILGIFATNIGKQRIIEESFATTPPLDWAYGTDRDNATRVARSLIPTGNFTVVYHALVEPDYAYDDPATLAEIPPALLPLEILHYLNPSRYCESDKLMRFAVKHFGELAPGYTRVNAICNWIYANVDYLCGSTSSQTSAYDMIALRAGVCRDFAHLGIAFCRALNIPARFVSGYAQGLVPQDFHAYFEAYLGNRWYVFDATRASRQNALVRIGIGRDAADVSFATFFGAAEMRSMKVFANFIGEAESALQSPEMTLAAVATL